MIKARSLALALPAVLALLPATVAAQDLPANLVAAEIRGGWRTESGTQMAALHLTLAPGWKTYWRAPGEAGFPPQFDWSGSANIADATIHWPTPELFDLNGLRFAGYRDELVLPIEFRPAVADRPMSVSGRIDLGVCETVCVPVSFDVAADLDPAGGPDPMIRSALANQPEPAATAGLSRARCSVEPIRDGLRLTSELTMPQIGPEEFAVVELADRSIWVSQAETVRAGGDLVAVADLVPSNAAPFALDRSSVHITVFGGSGRAVDLQGCTG
ncbi:protein-disulfide reductase DsbD domain-containing protein [Defluviimonas salinarum]|uniref:Protein-disulfide reductase DsbD family protein n=1 Tax=Defluviimonas salinarum TaxID=2992147 RepID=A0ABT3IYB6_9RHOB|nr:protein-disulfide reductase DsbD domain-containing protein [Defluviimonas salinarum]MCW3780427.1 protein-disulfide reductase DsbD family protein [Defluviimonas salinarum]